MFFSGSNDLSAADVEHLDALSHDLSFRGWDWELDPLHFLWLDAEDIVNAFVNHFWNPCKPFL